MRRRTFCGSTISAGIAAVFPATNLIAQIGGTTAVPGEIQAVTANGTEVSIAPVEAVELKESLEGALLSPGDDRYDSARRIWNGMIDKHPAMIVMCANAQDVSKAVAFAGERNLLLAVRGGGHSFPGKSVCEKGLMINLSAMNAVTVDAESRTARALGGALLGQLDGATLPHRLATTAGVVSHTGVGGFTLGGGMGRTDRVFGLAVDNLLGATLVTADGQVRVVGPDQEPDLYWAIRGGGGNFGVVTEYVYRLHPFNPMIYGGVLAYPWSQAKDVLSYWAEAGDSLPDGASVEPAFFINPDGERTVIVELYFTGDHAAGEKEFDRFVRGTRPLSSDLGVKSYQVVQTQYDGAAAHGRLDYLKSGFIPELTQDTINAMVESYEGDSLPSTWFQHLGGASSRVDPQATAFAHRRVHSNYGIDGSWTNPRESEARIAKIREVYAAVQPYMSGFYTNLNEDTKSKTEKNYGVNYERLLGIKRRYDPANLFRLNANIDPAAA
jgi:FAD/FMN-containing dehydrogenase